MKIRKLIIENSAGGYAALVTTLVVIAASLTVIGGLAFFSLQEARVNRAFTKSIESRVTAEAGAEDAIYRILSGRQISVSETIGLGKGTTTVTVTTSGASRIVRSAADRDNFRQSIEVAVEPATSASAFFYGAQVGDGGIEMKNTSRISGSVYSNGPVSGENGAVITGDVLAATTSAISGELTVGGRAHAYRIAGSGQIAVAGSASSTTLIDRTSVGQNAAADTFANSAVTGNAYYKTSISADTTVLGARIQIPQAPAPLLSLPMPVGDAQLDQWEQEAAAGGTYTGACPYVIDSGQASIGPLKVPCDMDIKGTAEVTLKGTLWVAGELTIQNSAIVRLDPSYGAMSGLIIIDKPTNRSAQGVLIVKNSAQIIGSGLDGSYVMLVSRNNSAESGGAVAAIQVDNTSSAPIYYAPHGLLHIKNNTGLKEAAAYKLKLENSVVLTYESGVQNVRFTAGPSAGYGIKYWKEVE